MTPERKKEINGHVIEEYYWNRNFVVYVDNLAYEETFEKACEVVEKWEQKTDSRQPSANRERY